MVSMNTITFLITVYNKERYIAKVIESLKSISGNFIKEFIIIDDGSTDSSLEIIRQQTASLKNTLIITQKNQGPAIALNKGISLSSGDYVFFVDGDDIIEENGPRLLLKACHELKTNVAFGLRGTYDPKTGERKTSSRARSGFCHSEVAISDRGIHECGRRPRYSPYGLLKYVNLCPGSPHFACDNETTLITSPLSALLKGKISRIRSIGSSGSLVKRDLLKQVNGCDENVFVQDFSLALRCAKYSNFAYVHKNISFAPLSYDEHNLSSNKNYEYYNSLKALANFIESNPEIAENLKNEFHQTFWSIMKKIYKYDFKIFYQYILSKYTIPKFSVTELLTLYQKNIRKLL